MVPRKTWVSENFGPISKTLEVFLMGLEVSFLSDFCVLESRTFLPTDLRVSDLLFFLSIWCSGVEIWQSSWV